jgi:hypothetical protein
VTCTRFYRRVSYKGRFDQLARWCRHGQRTICSHRRARGAWALADNLRLIIPASRRNKTAKPDDHPARKVKTPFPVLSFFGRGSRELWLDGSVLWDVTARRDVSIQICWSRPLHCTALYCTVVRDRRKKACSCAPFSLLRCSGHTQKKKFTTSCIFY